MTVAPTAPPYIQGADLPDLALKWYDGNGAVRDFSSGWTFVVKVGQPGSTAQFTKSTGITGASSLPNVTIAWATSNELNTVATGSWILDIIATRTSDSKQLIGRVVLPVIAPIT